MADRLKQIDASLARLDAVPPSLPRPKLNGQRSNGPAEDQFPPIESLLEHGQTKFVPPVRQPLDWSKLENEHPPEREWRISYWLSTGPTLFAGRGGVGKSLVAQTIATALCIGQNYIDQIDEPRKVLLWACEDDRDELWRRQIAICSYFSIKMSALTDKLIVEPRLGCENALFTAVFGRPQWTSLRDELREQMNDYRADVLIADNTSHLFGCNENDRHHVTSFVNGLTGLVTDRPTSQIILSHPAKAGDSEFSGSTAWENSVRMRWFMGAALPDKPQPEEGTEDPNVRYLAKRKTNYSVKDYRKLEFGDGVFKPEQPSGDISTRYNHSARIEDAERCVMAAVRQFNDSKMRVTAARNTDDSLVRQMGLSKDLAKDFTVKELSEAIANLRRRSKLIEKPVGSYQNRTPKMGLVAFDHSAQSECTN